MTTRVQKGGTVFRPVAKAKARPSSSTNDIRSASERSTSISDPCTSGYHPFNLPSSHTSDSNTLTDDVRQSTTVPPGEPTSSVIFTHGSVPTFNFPQNQNIPAMPVVMVASEVSGVQRPLFNGPPSLLISQMSNAPVHGNASTQLHCNSAVPPPGSAVATTSSSVSMAPELVHQVLGGDPIEGSLLYTVGASVVNVPHVQAEAPSSRQASSALHSSESAPFTSGSQVQKPIEGVDARNVRRRPRKRRSVSGGGETDGLSEAAHKRCRKSPESSTRARRTQSPTLPLLDPSTDPGEELDPTVTTMATLCSDTGQGRVSSKAAEIQTNHAAWKVQNKERRVRMRTLVELKKYGRNGQDGQSTTGNEGPPTPQLKTATAENDADGSFDYTQDLTTNRYAVQVRIGPNGETVINEESLVVDRQEDANTDDYTHVTESDITKFVNSGSYGKKPTGSRWSREETECFYHALSQYGENYELIAYVLPGRNRRACKNKFKAEDRRNPERINFCLNNRIPVDVDTLSRMTGKDFSGPVPVIHTPDPPSRLQHPLETQVSSSPQETTSLRQTRAVRKRSTSRSINPMDDAQIIGDRDTFGDE